jgi:hypothetical protein
VTKRITTQFVIENLLTLQALRHFKPSTRGLNYVARCSYPSKWRALLTWKKAKYVLQFEQNHSATLVQRWFQTNYGKEAPTRKSIYKWHKSFAETSCICAKKKNSGRRPIGETVESVRESFFRSPQKSTRGSGRDLIDVSHMAVWMVLRKRLSFRPYKFELLQELKSNDRPHRRDFCTEMLNGLEEDNLFLNKTVFSDEATFHLSGKVNRHNLIILGSQNPHEVVEHVRDSPKVIVFCAVSQTQAYEPFFFAEATVTGHVYLDMLEHFPASQLDVNNMIWQQDGAPPHYHRYVTRYLNQTFPERWIGRGGYIPWPPRSPDLTSMDFSLWGFVKR